MIIKILYFGLIADLIGKHSEEMEWNEHTKNIRLFFDEKYPRLKTLKYKIAIDSELMEEIPNGKTIKEIALLPPFAGG